MRLLILAGLAGALAPLAAIAQDNWPARAVTIVTATAAGGSADIESRLYAKKLSENTGQQFLVDPRPGAGGRLGPSVVAKAAPDGNTLLAVTGSFTLAPALFKTLPYDSLKDFAPVTLLTKRTTMLIANVNFPPRNVAEYIAHARANPDKINFATSGLGNPTHLAGAWMHDATNTRVTFVHYKGTAYMTDLVSGRVDVGMVSLLVGLAQIKAGKMKALGLTSLERSPLAPDLPTVAETINVPDFEYPSWFGISAPARTPAAVVNRIHAEFVKAVKSPEISQKLEREEGSVIIAGTLMCLRMVGSIASTAPVSRAPEPVTPLSDT